MITFVVDPGHGGTQPAYSSTPFGVVGPTGLREKDVTLLVAQRLVPRLGGKTLLTRSKDENLRLGGRAEIARRAGADVFLSIHANSCPRGACGSEIWVHERGSPASMALARSLARQLRRLGGPADVRRGAMAVLSPEHHAPHTAACLVELDNLSDPAGERRLRDPSALDGMATDVAEGTRYGRTVALAETDWPTRLSKLIPDTSPDFQQLDYTVDVREAISAVFGLEAWDDVVSAGEKEMEDKLKEALEAVEKLPISEEIKLTIFAGGFLFLAELAPAGLGYLAGREKVARSWARKGFSIGVVWAADDRTPSETKQAKYQAIWTDYALPKRGDLGPEFDPATIRIARNCYRMGVIGGMISARELTTTQKFNLFSDLAKRDPDARVDWQSSERPPESRPIEFYWGAAGLFQKYHLASDD